MIAVDLTVDRRPVQCIGLYRSELSDANDTKRAALQSAALSRSSHISQGCMSGCEGVAGVTGTGGVCAGVVTTGAGPESGSAACAGGVSVGRAAAGVSCLRIRARAVLAGFTARVEGATGDAWTAGAFTIGEGTTGATGANARTGGGYLNARVCGTRVFHMPVSKVYAAVAPMASATKTAPAIFPPLSTSTSGTFIPRKSCIAVSCHCLNICRENVRSAGRFRFVVTRRGIECDCWTRKRFQPRNFAQSGGLSC